jgi:Dyp-type peroxidase family
MSLVVPPIEARRLSDAKGREHFGFADGISQPILQGSTDAQRFPESPHVTALGEFVFGYRDEHGATSGPADGAAAFARNGTYLVARQIEQHVGEFHAFCERATLSNGAPDPEAASRLEAKIIGRLPDGTPLVPNGDRRDNDFGFAEDPFGYGCPVGAHVRRANPRGSLGNQNVPHEPDNAHRILRRARSYGSSYHPGVLDSGRGLLFLALNADIERQFEFIQQNWINSPSFNGIDGERDPLVGGDVVPHQTFTIPGVPAPCRIHNVPRFVNVVGGQYFFLPGKQALLSLAGGS